LVGVARCAPRLGRGGGGAEPCEVGGHGSSPRERGEQVVAVAPPSVQRQPRGRGAGEVFGEGGAVEVGAEGPGGIEGRSEADRSRSMLSPRRGCRTVQLRPAAICIWSATGSAGGCTMVSRGGSEWRVEVRDRSRSIRIAASSGRRSPSPAP